MKTTKYTWGTCHTTFQRDKYGSILESMAMWTKVRVEQAWRNLMKMNSNALSMWHNRKFWEFGKFVYVINELYVIYLCIILFIARKCTIIKIAKE